MSKSVTPQLCKFSLIITLLGGNKYAVNIFTIGTKLTFTKFGKKKASFVKFIGISNSNIVNSTILPVHEIGMMSIIRIFENMYAFK